MSSSPLMPRKRHQIDSFEGFGRNPEGAMVKQPAEVTVWLLQSFKWLQPSYHTYLVTVLSRYPRDPCSNCQDRNPSGELGPSALPPCSVGCRHV